jgi:cytochrome c553
MIVLRSFVKPARVLQIRAAALAALSFALPASADSVDAGKAKAASCTVCHGANGISQMPGAPNLAGQQALYTTEQLKNFRSGKRVNEIMNVIAKPLTDADINDLAVWFESIKSDSPAR